MSTPPVRIEGSVAETADVSTLAGLPVSLHGGLVRLDDEVVVEEDAVRRLSELERVAREPVGRDGSRVEYRMLNGVRLAGDDHLEGLALRYELTAMTGRPIGWEAAKTAGHVHVRPDGARLGYPEVVEVLHGVAGFLIQDLSIEEAGPSSTRAWLVRAHAGDRVVFPPMLAHVTINLGAGPLLFSDVIDRRASGIYSDVAAARGFAWYVGADGSTEANPRYLEHPPLEEIGAGDWSSPVSTPLYRAFSADPNAFGWLSDPDRFPEVAPDVWARVRYLLVDDR